MSATPVVIQPDVEQVLAVYLLPHLTSSWPNVVVSNQYSGGNSAVWIRRDGGRRLDVLREQMTVGINCYGSTREDASLLARTVCGLLLAFPNGAPVTSLDHTSGPQPVEDKQAREFMTFDVTTRGTQQS